MKRDAKEKLLDGLDRNMPGCGVILGMIFGVALALFVPWISRALGII